MVESKTEGKKEDERFSEFCKVFLPCERIASIIYGGVFPLSTDPTAFPELPHCIDTIF